MKPSVILVGLIVLSIAWPAICRGEDEATAAGNAFFEKKIRPLLASRCYDCHSIKAKKLKGGLRFDSRAALLSGGDSGPVVVSGKPNNSLLIEAVRYENSDLQMPPKGKLPDREIALLVKWIEIGAPMPAAANPRAVADKAINFKEGRKFWSFQPVTTKDLPAGDETVWLKNKIDAFVLANLERNRLHPSPPADRRTLIRRVTFDLVGLPPTPDEVEAFLADESSNAYDRLVDRLLASPQYGERWGRVWLDLARYTDTTATWLKSTARAHLYRDWIVRSLNEDLPYDQFAKRQLATDLMPETGPDDIPALGLLGLSPTYWKELKLDQNVIKAIVAEEWEERIDMVGRTFLGLTVACARCHDHKFDPVSTSDYYALAGVFASTRLADRKIISEDESRAAAKAREKVAALEKDLAELKKKKPAANQVETGVKTPVFANDYAAAIAKLKPSWHEPLNKNPERLAVEKGVAVTPDNYAKFTEGRLHAKLTVLGADYTVAFWFRNDTQNEARPVTGYLFSRGPNGGTGAPGDHLGIGGTASKTSGTLFLYNGDRAKGILGGNTIITPGSWNHVVLARGGNRATLWLNGGPQPEFDGEIKATAPDSTEFFLGGRNERFALIKGRLAQLSFFNRAVSAIEARQLHAASGQPVGPKTEPKEIARPAIAKSDPKAKIEKLTREIESIKKNTPHYDSPLAPAVEEASLYVEAKGANETRLDYRPGRARDLKVQIRGNPANLGPLVPRRFLQVLSEGTPAPFEQGSGRLELANCIFDEAGPLAARVFVNRVWMQHFGRGLVATPSNFGRQGSKPTHPKLLDDLAARFIEQDWSIKWLHRQIVRSATYRQASQHDSQKIATDPDNRWLWRMNRRQLDVESWRDAMLAVTGRLNLQIGGAPLELSSADNHRRTIYGRIHRRELDVMLRLYDFPNPISHSPARERTITPLQQLFVLNGDFVRRQAEALVHRLHQATGPDLEAKIRLAYELLYTRSPTAEEVGLAKKFLAYDLSDDSARREFWRQYAQVLLGGNEFLFID
ncbi:MAG: DUF1553 domain-containing protein [Pirellulales bacterium]